MRAKRDTKAANLFGFCCSLNRNIVLKKGGKVELPISLITPNTNYICVISCKKYNGNGKLFVNIAGGQNLSTTSILLNKNLCNKYINF